MSTPVTLADVRQAAADLLATSWRFRSSGQYPVLSTSDAHAPGHYDYACALCRPDLDDGAVRIVTRVLETLGIPVVDEHGACAAHPHRENHCTTGRCGSCWRCQADGVAPADAWADAVAAACDRGSCCKERGHAGRCNPGGDDPDAFAPGAAVTLAHPVLYLAEHHGATPGVRGYITAYSRLAPDDDGFLVDWGNGVEVRANRSELVLLHEPMPCGHGCPHPCSPYEHEEPERVLVYPPPVHACPPAGGAVVPCCSRDVLALPRTDRMTTDPAAVTCRRGATATVTPGVGTYVSDAPPAEPAPAATVEPSPDCAAGKHTPVCAGTAWDDAADALVDCPCGCHTIARTLAS